VAERDHYLLGFVSSHRFAEKAAYSSSVGTSVYVHVDAVGQGIGKRLYAVLFEALAVEKLHRAYAGITQPNPASVALHLSVGFTELGTYDEVGYKFDRYWRVQWFERRL